MYDAKTGMHHCDSCDRMMNPTDRLTDLYLAPNDPRRDDPSFAPRSMGVCPAGGCWKDANARGYFARTQVERGDHLA